MDKYKVLGVDENASMEEIKRAYEDKVKKFKEEITDERRAKAFIKVFEKAYEEIKLEREKSNNQQTMVMDINSIDLNEYSSNNIDKNDLENNVKLKVDEVSTYKDKEISKKKKNTLSSKNSYRKKTKKDIKTQDESSNKDKEVKRNKKDNRKVVVKQREEGNLIITIVKLLLKIIALPIIAILSIIIFLCKIINVVSWIASKVIIIAAIAASAIHGYQIYIGHAIQYEIFILSAVGFIVSLFLPSILRTVPSILESVNNKLKRFVF